MEEFFIDIIKKGIHGLKDIVHPAKECKIEKHELLDMVDENQLSMRPAVKLSYFIESEDHTPSHVQVTKMCKFSEEEHLSNEVILSIMQEDKPNLSKHYKLPREKIHRFFPANISAKVIEETIIKALELWQGNNK